MTSYLEQVEPANKWMIFQAVHVGTLDLEGDARKLLSTRGRGPSKKILP